MLFNQRFNAVYCLKTRLSLSVSVGPILTSGTSPSAPGPWSQLGDFSAADLLCPPYLQTLAAIGSTQEGETTHLLK